MEARERAHIEELADAKAKLLEKVRELEGMAKEAEVGTAAAIYASRPPPTPTHCSYPKAVSSFALTHLFTLA